MRRSCYLPLSDWALSPSLSSSDKLYSGADRRSPEENTLMWCVNKQFFVRNYAQRYQQLNVRVTGVLKLKEF